jgi:hypothetical protein
VDRRFKGRGLTQTGNVRGDVVLYEPLAALHLGAQPAAIRTVDSPSVTVDIRGAADRELAQGACIVRPLQWWLGGDELMRPLVGHPEHFPDVTDGHTLAGQVMG